jgi:hypothetical protein
MKRMMVSTFLLLLLVSVAQAATYYVDHQCGNVSTYVPATRACTGGVSVLSRTTVSAGVALAGAGDTVYIRAGTYLEAVTNIPGGSSWSAPVTVARYQSESVTLRPGSGTFSILAFPLTTQHYIIVDGLILDGITGDGDGIRIKGSVPPAHHIRIKNTEVKNTWENGVVVTTGADYNEFTNLNVHTFGRSAKTVRPPHGFYVSGDFNLIEKTQIHEGHEKCIQFYSSSGANPTQNIFRENTLYACQDGLAVFGSDNTIYRNIFRNMTSHGMTITYGRNKVYNNTIYANSGTGIVMNSGATNTMIKNNIIYQNGTGTITGAPGSTVQTFNLFTNPLFTNPPTDLTLQTGSAAINTGTSEICSPTQVTAGICSPVTNVSGCDAAGCDKGRFEKGVDVAELVGQYLCNNDAGVDSSGVNNHLTLTGVTFDTIRREGSHSCLFDASTDKAVMLVSGWKPTTWSFGGWVRFTGFAATQYILGHNRVGAYADRIQIKADATGQLQLGIGDNSQLATGLFQFVTGTDYYIGLSLNSGAWNLIVVQNTAGVVKRASGTYNSLTQIGEATLGNIPLGANSGLNGRLDVIKIWNVAKTTDQFLADCALFGTCPPTDVEIYQNLVLGTGANDAATGKIITVALTSTPVDPLRCANLADFVVTYATVPTPVASCNISNAATSTLTLNMLNAPATGLAISLTYNGSPASGPISITNNFTTPVATANRNMTSYRCRANVNRDTHPWPDDPDLPCAVTSPSTINLRVSMENTTGASLTAFGTGLSCARQNPGEGWSAFVQLTDLPDILGLSYNRTTNKLPDGTLLATRALPMTGGFTYVAGTVRNGSPQALLPTIATNGSFQEEYALAVADGMAVNTKFCCRLVEASGSLLNVYPDPAGYVTDCGAALVVKGGTVMY